MGCWGVGVLGCCRPPQVYSWVKKIRGLTAGAPTTSTTPLSSLMGEEDSWAKNQRTDYLDDTPLPYPTVRLAVMGRFQRRAQVDVSSTE